MLALLQSKHQPPQQPYEGFPPSHDPNAPYDPAMQPYYYPAPPGHEGPYQPYAYPMLSPPEGQPPMQGFMPSGDANSPGGVHNLPPADIARTIPCRYVVFLRARHYHGDGMPRCASLRDPGASFLIFSDGANTFRPALQVLSCLSLWLVVHVPSSAASVLLWTPSSGPRTLSANVSPARLLHDEARRVSASPSWCAPRRAGCQPSCELPAVPASRASSFPSAKRCPAVFSRYKWGSIPSTSKWGTFPQRSTVSTPYQWRAIPSCQWGSLHPYQHGHALHTRDKRHAFPIRAAAVLSRQRNTLQRWRAFYPWAGASTVWLPARIPRRTKRRSDKRKCEWQRGGAPATTSGERY